MLPQRIFCDPNYAPLAEAIRQAKAAAAGLDLDLSRFLQMQCFSSEPQLPLIFRGLEVLEAITEEGKLLTLLRPFLKSGDPQIASKCVLVLGRRCHNVSWMRKVMAEVDDRIRANLVESLWERKEPEIELVLRSALNDPHHRVAANAVYGLFLLGSDSYKEGLDHLVASGNSACRRAAIWVIRSTNTPESAMGIKPLIRDTDPAVRRAAFDALVFLRQQAAQVQPVLPEPVVREPAVQQQVEEPTAV